MADDEKIKSDAEGLKNAMKGAGTDEEAIINVAVNRTSSERIQIRDKYKALFGTDLIEDFKSELSGKFEDAIIQLFTDPFELDADELKKSTKGLGTDEDTLIEIIASRSPGQLQKIKEAYKKKYNVELEEDVKDDTSGYFKKLLVAIMQCGRSSNETPIKEECVKIAEILYKAGEGKLGTDEETFIKYIANSSPAELAAIAREYHKLTGNTMKSAIESEFSGDVKNLLISVLYSQISPSEYFATRINKAIKGLGTDNKLLIRVVVTRSEIDMPKIRQYYKQLYQKDMIKEVESDVSGDYKKLIVALCKK